jgi:hypothetical protein
MYLFIDQMNIYLVALLDGPITPPETAPLQSTVADAEGTNPENSGSGIPLRAINAVASHVPFIEDARTKVTNEMENMVLTGLTTLVCQTAPLAGPVLIFHIESITTCIISSDSI